MTRNYSGVPRSFLSSKKIKTTSPISYHSFQTHFGIIFEAKYGAPVGWPLLCKKYGFKCLCDLLQVKQIFYNENDYDNDNSNNNN